MKIPFVVLQIAKKVRKEIIKTNDGISSGMCCDASDEIVELLRKKGIKSETVTGGFRNGNGKWSEIDYHCWVKIDKFILDVTADQFNHEKFKMKAIVWGTNKQLHNRYKAIPKQLRNRYKSI